MIKVRKEEAGTCDFDKEYDKLQMNQDNNLTIQLLDMAQLKFHVCINRW